MPSNRFPYDKLSDEALVMLLQEVRPNWGVTTKNVKFENFIYSPTDVKRGRTFVSVVFTDLGITAPFCYRRLDLGRALGDEITLTVDGDITSTKIVEEINRLRQFVLSNQDVYMNDRVLAREGEGVTYRMRARAVSPVWYGEVVVKVASKEATMPSGIRLLEDGTPRLMEDGSYRLLEG